MFSATETILLASLVATISGVVGRLSNRTKLSRDDHETLCGTRLTAINTRFDTFNGRIDRIEGKLDKVIEHLPK